MHEAALRALSVSYAASVDERDGGRFAALFTRDGELVVPDVPTDLRPVIIRSGHDALRRIPDALRRYTRTFHQLSNLHFEVGEGTARGDVWCAAHHVTANAGEDPGPLGTDVVWYIHYVDDYRLETEGWRIRRRELHLQWIEERPVSVVG